MRSKPETDVLVVGAGPVGLTAALALRRAGVAPVVIDEEERTAIHGYALALHPASLELLAGLGVADELVAAGRRIAQVAFYEGGERRAALDLSHLDSPFPFVLVLPQSALEDCLRRHLGEAGLKVRWTHRLAALSGSGPYTEARIDHLDRVSVGYPVADASRVVVGEEQLRPRFVIGADGHRSRVRRLLGAQFEHVAEGRMFLVFEFDADGADIEEARVLVGDGLLTGLWPLVGRRYRFSCELGDPSAYQPRADERRLVQRLGQSAYPHIAEERLAELLDQRAPWFNAAVTAIHWSLAVRFDRRVTSSMGRDRVWLAGDAAHLMLPLGMQSMNVGLAEAGRLAAAIADRLGDSGNESSLDPYPPDHLQRLRQLVAAGDGFVADAVADPWTRGHVAQIVATAPATGAHLTALLRQVGVGREDLGDSLV